MAGNWLLGRQKMFFWPNFDIYITFKRIFEKSKKIDFQFFFKIFRQKMAEISADRPEIGQIMLLIPPDKSKLFQKKMPDLEKSRSGGILKSLVLR